VTRSFYLVNAEAKQAQSLVRTIAKSRDIHVDERLNLLVVRDTPEVIRLIERLLASIDLAEPEVVLEVEVLEVATNRMDEIGLQWPESLQFGLTGVSGQVELSQRGSFRTSIANPALLATLRGTSGRGNVLANPRLRARNHEKAKVMIGEKLPVFTTTSTANVGVSASVAYLDVGLKLEFEPSVQLDNDVVIKVNLDITTLIGAVPGPQGSVAYRVGARQANTSLRLRDGETQVLAGLIRDEDTKSVAGVPGLSGLPLVGRLFGKHTDERNKSEIVLLITPHVVRNLGLPDSQGTNTPAGVEANPGAAPLRLTRNAAVALAVGSGSGAAAPRTALPDSESPDTPEAERTAVLVLATSGRVDAGAAAAITLQNRSTVLMRGELVFDPLRLASTQGGANADGRTAFELSPGAERVILLRVLPAAAGQTVNVSVAGLQATLAAGDAVAVRIDGDGALQVGKP
jgi:general secretion pathway protein D